MNAFLVRKNKVWHISETYVRPVWPGYRKREENVEDEFGEMNKTEILQCFVGSSKECELYSESNGKQ